MTAVLTAGKAGEYWMAEMPGVLLVDMTDHYQSKHILTAVLKTRQLPPNAVHRYPVKTKEQHDKQEARIKKLEEDALKGGKTFFRLAQAIIEHRKLSERRPKQRGLWKRRDFEEGVRKWIAARPFEWNISNHSIYALRSWGWGEGTPVPEDDYCAFSIPMEMFERVWNTPVDINALVYFRGRKEKSRGRRLVNMLEVAGSKEDYHISMGAVGQDHVSPIAYPNKFVRAWAKRFVKGERVIVGDQEPFINDEEKFFLVTEAFKS